ncbi:MAG: prolipoprotein diacylglyceryl transferase [Candidatus Wallbacteria bacterium]|nr:prolipoprotein diacylglyceryl transferase [Candidatus Wallbacteria bacterium]
MHQILFKLGPITLYSYGLMIALAFLAGIYLSRRIFVRMNKTVDLVYDLALVIIVSSILGARIFYVLNSGSYFLDNPLEIFKIYKGGLVFYGGFIGGLIGGYCFARLRHYDFFELADAVVPVVALGQSIGRIGCFLNGCCYGQVSDTYGIVFPELRDGLLRLPTQIFESAGDLLIFVILYRMLWKRRFHGENFSLYLILYGILRFMIEFLRGDPRGSVYFGCLSVGQLLSLVGVLTGMTIYLLGFRSRQTGRKG